MSPNRIVALLTPVFRSRGRLVGHVARRQRPGHDRVADQPPGGLHRRRAGGSRARRAVAARLAEVRGTPWSRPTRARRWPDAAVAEHEPDLDDLELPEDDDELGDLEDELAEFDDVAVEDEEPVPAG